MTALVPRRDYLAGQRRSIIARSIMGSLAGAVPLPFVDTWAIDRIVGGGYKRIAASHQVDLTDEAAANLTHGTTPPPSLLDMATSGIALRIATTAARRMMVALATVNRARSAARTFMCMTLFDHYCAKLHTGLAIDGATALLLREEILRAIEQTPGALAFHPFRRGVLSAARATLKAPLELADLASRGALRRLLANNDTVAEPKQIDETEQAIEAALAEKTNFLARTVTAVEMQLSSEVNPYLDGAIEALDRRWRARQSTKVDP
ncbi:MAG TPA: hypothetical protein VFQ65_04835 [Kofleriaceae bacterium]|nr:hypothetical protein [Kofleriaceae bacterium]